MTEWLSTPSIGPVLAYIGPGAGFAFLGSFFLLFLAFLLLALALLSWPFRFLYLLVRRRRRPKGKARRVVVVGLDGFDPKRAKQLMSEGHLPQLSSLADDGSFHELGTTHPPLTPVAWSSFMTGVNPGKHNIFDFLNRDLRSYRPVLSSSRIDTVAGRVFKRSKRACVTLLRKSTPVWHILGRHGIHSSIIRMPITFPPERFDGLSLSAMCTPDLRGSQGTFTLYTTAPAADATDATGHTVRVERSGRRIETRLSGPPDPRSGNDFLSVPVTVAIDDANRAATISIAGRRFTLGEQAYSPWIPVVFRSGWMSRAHGICRFYVNSVEPEFRMYATPVHIDPEKPSMPISHPSYYALYLAKLHGPFATLGLAEDTWALNEGALPEQGFLDQAYDIHAEREAMFFEALKNTRSGLLACVFDASDRIQHMFYRYTDPTHPANAGKPAEHPTAIDDMYRRMDQLVGRVREQMNDNDLLFVMSDHGFANFRRGINLNVWLREHGYLALRDDEATAAADYLANVDWSRTRAYTFGLTGIYLNLQGRESEGIVSPADAAALRREIAKQLRGLRDGDETAILEVYDNADVYSGPYAKNGPDLVVGYNGGYHAAWEAVVGRTDGGLFSDNTKHWSGDHCVDRRLVPGVLFCNRPIALDDATPDILDMAPTLLEQFGVPVPDYMEGTPLPVQSMPTTARDNAENAPPNDDS